MTAATPPLCSTLRTLSAKEASPRWQSTTAPVHAPSDVHSPPSTMGPPTPVVRGAPVILPPDQVVPPLLREFTSSQGTEESTATPGAAISTSRLCCEKEALASSASTAATETTEA